MSHQNKKRTQVTIRFLFVIVAIIIGALSYLSYSQLDKLKESNKLVNHTNEVKAEIYNYSSLFKDIILFERGFVISKNVKYLNKINHIINLSDISLKSIKRKTRDNNYYREELETITRIQESIKNHLFLVTYVEQSDNEINIYLNQQKIKLDRIRQITTHLILTENILLKIRNDALSKANVFTPLVILILLMFCVAILIISYLNINKSLNSKQKLIETLLKNEKELKAANNALNEKKEEVINLKTNEKFKIIADTMPQFIWTADQYGELNFFSESVYNYTGKKEKQFLIDGWLDIVHPEDREQNIEKWAYSIKTGHPFDYEHRFRRFDGEYRWQLSRALPIKNEAGDIEQWVGTSTDIHEQKTFLQELEIKVDERTQSLKTINESLEKSNEDLAQFAYVASHDLQEPLRKIRTFSQMISEKEIETLSEKGVMLFERINKSAVRMQELINDVLAYSKTGSSNTNFVDVDLNDLIDNIEKQFQLDLSNKDFELFFEKLPTIKGIKVQLEQVFSNLLSNAIKFKQENIKTKVTITYTIVDNLKGLGIDNHLSKRYHLITISDNGIGFENEYKNKMFQVFQQLNPKELFQGTGIGLALVKKIVEGHQGFVDAEGEINVGAKFRLYFPIN